MTRFKRICFEAKRQGIIVEKVGGSEPYEVYAEDDHSAIGLCRNLDEVELDVAAFADQKAERDRKREAANYVI
jgi:hypothetical protein